MRLIRILLTLVVLAALAYGAVIVPLGQKTLWEHIRSIAGTKESQELVDGVKDKALQVIHTDGGTKIKTDNLTSEERGILRRLIKDKLQETQDKP